MNITLTKEECHNVKAALVMTAKRSDVDENAMKMLLVLSDKFTFAEVSAEIEKVTVEESHV